MSARSTGTIEARQLRRSRSDRTLAGVCGGLAAYFEIHPAVFRVAFVVLTLLGGAGVLIYLAAAAVMPAEDRVDSFATATLRDVRDRRWSLVGLGLVVVGAAMALSRLALWPGGDAWVFLLLVGALILWIATSRRDYQRVVDRANLAAELRELEEKQKKPFDWADDLDWTDVA
jgi:phage shock protein C